MSLHPPWDDTVAFHARLFRCFLLRFLDALAELAVLSRVSSRILARLGQRRAGRSHEPGPHRVFPPGHHDDWIARCPPKRGYEATRLPSFAVTPPSPAFASPVFSHPINITHGPYPPVIAFDPPGLSRVLGGDDGPPTDVVGFLLLWVLVVVLAVFHWSSAASAPSASARALPTMAVHPTTRSPLDYLLIHEPTSGDGSQASMPGAWLHEHRDRPKMCEEPVFDTTLRTLFYSCTRVGMRAWNHLTSILAASGPWDCGSNDVVAVRRRTEDGCLPGCQGLGLNALDAGVPTSVLPNGAGQRGAVRDRLQTESSVFIKDLRQLAMAVRNRRYGLVAHGDVATKDLNGRNATLDVVYGDKIGSMSALVVTSSTDHLLCQEDTASDDDESTEDGSDESEDDGLFGVDTQSTGDRLQDNSAPPKRSSTGYLWRKRDTSDEDEDEDGTGDDSYWTEQVKARLSGQRESHRASCRHGLSDFLSCPRRGRRDESDDWRTRSSRVAPTASHKDVSDAMQCQARPRQSSSPPLGVETLLSRHVGSGDGPQGIYVVPQKRGRCWSPPSSPKLSDRPSGLGFFPFRKTPSLLTPEAWRPGCLYVPDPPADESRRADVWWESLRCRSGPGAGFGFGTGAVTEDAAEQGDGAAMLRDAQEVPVSWRDRHENDPASRRFASVHRRATTEG